MPSIPSLKELCSPQEISEMIALYCSDDTIVDHVLAFSCEDLRFPGQNSTDQDRIMFVLRTVACLINSRINEQFSEEKGGGATADFLYEKVIEFFRILARQPKQSQVKSLFAELFLIPDSPYLNLEDSNLDDRTFSRHVCTFANAVIEAANHHYCLI